MPRAPGVPRPSQSGVTLIELVITVAIGSLIVAGLSGIVSATFRSKQSVIEHNELTRQAGFAMERIVRTVSHSTRLTVPQADNPGTNWREHVREQTVPASPPEGSSTNATAVLAVGLPLYVDLNFDGVPDADNDGDGRIDEDAPADRNYDFAPGLWFIDDDGDGSIDEGSFSTSDDDEQGGSNEDRLDLGDNDGDGRIDEDPGADMNGDGCPGICGVDDDGDSLVDEGSFAWDDDDEDSSTDEDWYDPVVFYLDNGTLKQRIPVPWDETGASGITGRDFVVADLADNVTLLRFERVPGSRYVLVDIRLVLSGSGGESVDLATRVRLGGAL